MPDQLYLNYPMLAQYNAQLTNGALLWSILTAVSPEALQEICVGELRELLTRVAPSPEPLSKIKADNLRLLDSAGTLKRNDPLAVHQHSWTAGCHLAEVPYITLHSDHQPFMPAELIDLLQQHPQLPLGSTITIHGIAGRVSFVIVAREDTAPHQAPSWVSLTREDHIDLRK